MLGKKLQSVVVLATLSFSLLADETTSLEKLLHRASVGDNTAQVAIAQYYFVNKETQNDAGAWLYLAYNNSKDETLMSLFAQKFQNASPEQLDKIEQKFIALHKTYGKEHTDAIYKPTLLSDKECEKNNPPKPLKRYSPVYPKELSRNNKIGYTKLEYTISKYGHARDLEVIKYTNRRLIKTSLDGLKYWQYTKTDNHQYNKQVQFAFSMQGVTVESDINKFSSLMDDNSSNIGKSQYQLIDQIENNRTFLGKKGKQAFVEQYKNLRGIAHSPFQQQEKNFWLTQSAQNGFAQAQYELSVNMSTGRGCKVNPVVAEHWLKAATLQNYLPAKALAGNNLLKHDSLEKHRLGIALLKKASEGKSYKTKLDLAWQLATSKFNELRDPELAPELIDDTGIYYRDKVRMLETEAAAYAALGDFDEAVDLQEDAIEEAQDLQWLVIPDEMTQRLHNYQQNKQVSGPYYL